MIYLVFLVYLLGFCVGLYLLKEWNKTREKYSRVNFDDAFFVSLFSWLFVIMLLYNSWYAKSVLKTKIDSFIKSFEDGK